MRWLEQCVDLSSRSPEEFPAGTDLHSFADYLVQNPPEPVRQKLSRWGVADYRSIFSRGIALNILFAEAPPRHILDRRKNRSQEFA
jgi:hypothetical protein